ncbi:MAG: PQQ-dependent sugar dehydrogenase [Burkholderiaceae bacterium]
MKSLLVGLLGLSLICPTAFGAAFEWGERHTSFEPAFAEQFRAPVRDSSVSAEFKTLAQGLDQPWGVDALPGGNGLLLTELSGQLRHLSMSGQLSEPIAGVPEVLFEGQGGLLDVAVSPRFDRDRTVYLSYSKPLDDGMTATAVARGRLSADRRRLDEVTDIFVQEPPSPTAKHFGSRIVFSGDGNLFITTGEHFTLEERQLSQDKSTTYGKVVRLRPDGSAPPDNPFVGDPDARDSIWSTGHRNVQGAAVDANGALWTIEHGPQGGDELQRPQAGENHGWPLVSYGERYSGEPVGTGEARAPGITEPVYFWDPVIAPGGAAFHHGEMFGSWNGDLLISAYVAKGLVRLEIGDDGRVAGEERLFRELGGVRDVHVLRDGSLIVLTDAAPGRVVHIVETR